MSREGLNNRLALIRCAIKVVKQQSHDINNVIFLNIDGFAHFADDLLSGFIKPQIRRGNGYTEPGCASFSMSRTLTEVEPYIPLILSNENLSLFLEAAVSNDEELIAELERAFVTDAKARFVNSAYNAEDDEWGEIVRTCEKIRTYREQSV
jgi:hypothetical protein